MSDNQFDYETYVDDDPNVIGIASSEGRTIVFISAPGQTLNWQRLVLFPTLDKNRVLVATPLQTLSRTQSDFPEKLNDYLNDFFSDAILLAEKHFATIG